MLVLGLACCLVFLDNKSLDDDLVSKLRVLELAPDLEASTHGLYVFTYPLLIDWFISYGLLRLVGLETSSSLTQAAPKAIYTSGSLLLQSTRSVSLPRRFRGRRGRNRRRSSFRISKTYEQDQTNMTALELRCEWSLS